MQLPFKKAKYDVDIDEPGLGELYGQRLTLRAEVLCLSCPWGPPALWLGLLSDAPTAPRVDAHTHNIPAVLPRCSITLTRLQCNAVLTTVTRRANARRPLASARQSSRTAVNANAFSAMHVALLPGCTSYPHLLPDLMMARCTASPEAPPDRSLGPVVWCSCSEMMSSRLWPRSGTCLYPRPGTSGGMRSASCPCCRPNLCSAQARPPTSAPPGSAAFLRVMSSPCCPGAWGLCLYGILRELAARSRRVHALFEVHACPNTTLCPPLCSHVAPPASCALQQACQQSLPAIGQ